MKKIFSIVVISLLTVNSFSFAEEAKEPIEQMKKIEYQEPTTGVEIVFSKKGDNWEKIMANSESELLLGGRQDVRQATSKAIMRAKASIAKFLKEKVNTSETIEEISKTISNRNATSVKAERKTVETLVEKISNSADEILKGVIVLEQEINKKDKYVHVKVGMSRKTMKTADSISNNINKNLAKDESSNTQKIKKYNNGQNEIRRSRNYDNF